MFSSSRSFALSMILLMGLCVVTGTLLNRFTGATPAQAQRSEIRRWEYCAIVGINFDPKKGLNGSSSASVAYFGDSGRRFESIEGNRNNDSMSAAIAKLGGEGWEMIGPGSQNLSAEHPDAIYFKRPAP